MSKHLKNSFAKSESYAEYGGQSINLEQFWLAVDSGTSYKKAAFETFSGKWAKNNGFVTVRIRTKSDITRETVMLNFIKNK